MKLRNALTMFGTSVATVLALAAPASAHAEVLLDETDRDPNVAPLALDGTDALTFLGVIEGRNDVRSFQFNMQAGQQVHLTLGIPNLAPENTYATDDLPEIELQTPDNTVIEIEPVMRVPVSNPEGMNFLFLHDYTATAIAGTYSVTVEADKPSRFLVATGQEGSVFDGIERGTVATEEQVEEWYATAP